MIYEGIAKFLRSVGAACSVGLMVLGVHYLTVLYASARVHSFYLMCGYATTGLVFILYGAFTTNTELLGLFEFYRKLSDTQWLRTRRSLGVGYLWAGCLCWCGYFAQQPIWHVVSHAYISFLCRNDKLEMIFKLFFFAFHP